MLAAFVLLLAPAQPIDRPAVIDLDAIAVAEARKLHGRAVLATLTADTPAVLRDQGDDVVTPVGPAPVDELERVAVLKGRRLDVMPGDKLKVRGVLDVIDHPAAVVGGVLVPAWVEVRVTER